MNEKNPSSSPPGLVDSLTTAVLLLDADYALQRINPAGENLVGVSAQRGLGRPIDTLLPGNDALMRYLRRVSETEAALTAREMTLYKFSQTGESLLVDCFISPLSRQQSDILLVELNQVDRLRRISREKHESQRLEANRAMLGGLAHEIKNPLGGLRGAAQLLDGELDSRDLRQYTRIITREADRLSALVDRMIGPRQPVDYRLLNIHEVLEHVARLLYVEQPELLALHRDYDPSLPLVPGDRSALIQAVLNIGRNAAQAFERGGNIWLRSRIEHQLTIGSERHRQAIRVDVQDDGPGIPEEIREHIFDPLVTGRADGTGLGLAITREIIDQHGGMVECVCRPGDTRFTFYLPVKPASNQN